MDHTLIQTSHWTAKGRTALVGVLVLTALACPVDAAGALALAIGITGLEIGAVLKVPGVSGCVGEAAAVVGRPLTPVSIAGVDRRTVRRCAVGIYDC